MNTLAQFKLNKTFLKITKRENKYDIHVITEHEDFVITCWTFKQATKWFDHYKYKAMEEN